MQKIRVCHVASGDAWAGAEAQIAMLLPVLSRYPDLDLSAILFNRGRLAEHLETTGIPLFVFDENTLSSWETFRKLLLYFTKNSFDILHTHGYKEHVLGSITGKLAGVPYILRTVHGLEEPFTGMAQLKMSVYTTIDNLINKYLTDTIVAVSHNIRQVLTNHLKTPIVTIHNGIALDRIKPAQNSDAIRENLGIKRTDHVVGTVGRLTPVKALKYFLQAARLIVDTIPNVKFLIVGEGACRQDLESRVKQMQLCNYVVFTGYREDVYDLISAMDIFVLSSIHEGIPTVLLEAMCARVRSACQYLIETENYSCDQLGRGCLTCKCFV